VKQPIETEKPRKDRKHSAVFFLLFSLLLSQAACARHTTAAATPEGAPVVIFISPRVDTTTARGEIVAFAISIKSMRNLVSVFADVRGALNYQFPAANPADTIFATVFRVPTTGAAGDSITLTVMATDINGVQGTGQRLVVIR
jgi:hypothetical protein